MEPKKQSAIGKQSQHFVPESFLRGFTENGNGWFHELRIKDKWLKKQHIANACCIDNFFDINEPRLLANFKINDPRYLETSFFFYENWLPKIISKIRKHEHFLSLTDFETIIEAYIGIKHRTKYYRKKLTDKKMTGSAFDTAAAQIRTDYNELIKYHNFDYDEFLIRFKESYLNDPEQPRNTHLSGLLESSHNINHPVREAKLKLLGMNILILEAKEGDYFFTSDNPGYSLNGNEMYNTNYAKFDKIHFPINSKQLILLQGFNPLNYINPLMRLKYISVDHSFVNEVNKMTRFVADEKIFCQDRECLKNFKHTM